MTKAGKAPASGLKLVMCGCTEYGHYLVKGLIESGIRFAQFVVLSPEQNSRYEISGYRDLTELARAHSIPVHIPRSYSLDSDDDAKFFEDSRFDLLIQGGWQRLFPSQILKTLRIGAVGVHGSADFLPKGRGRSPLNWSLVEGRRRFLLQLFLIQAGVDDGDVFDCQSFDINEHDTIQTLYFKSVIATKTMLLRSLPKLASGTIAYRPQAGVASYYQKRAPEDGAIDWEQMDVHQIHNLVRATTRPYPGAFGSLEGQPYKIWRAHVFDTRILYPSAVYGEVVERFENILIVNCRGGLLLVDDYEPM